MRKSRFSDEQMVTILREADAGRIGIHRAGRSYVDGTTVTVNFTSAVPEPSTWALFALGGILLLAARRKPPRRAADSRQPPTA